MSNLAQAAVTAAQSAVAAIGRLHEAEDDLSARYMAARIRLPVHAAQLGPAQRASTWVEEYFLRVFFAYRE